MAEKAYFTREGFDKIQAELLEMKTKGRAEIANAIEEAREKGDLRENAEYDAAKNAQGMHELKISKLENVIANAQIIDESKIDTSKVFILCTVKVKNVKNGQEMSYTLVSQKEANFKEGKISGDSPVGKALMGQKVGDVVKVKVPAGEMEFEILEISR